jgi:glycogen debranching enzyme
MLYYSKVKILFCVALSVILCLINSCAQNSSTEKLNYHFSGGYGQIEIGGKFVGLEFHHSRPLPSRISFYYPVANSVDLSEGYWTRDQSLPISMIIKSLEGIDTLGLIPYPYKYTPYRVNFKGDKKEYSLKVNYDVCEDLPVFILSINLKSNSLQSKKVTLTIQMNPLLRTSHSYAQVIPERIDYNKENSIAVAMYPSIETDSACVFVCNVGAQARFTEEVTKSKKIEYTYTIDLNQGEEQEIIQLIGMCSMKDYDTITKESIESWSKSVVENERRVHDYAINHSFFSVNDSALQKTMHWSKAVIASNIHYINEQYLPMPCPAEYNFFFTHDLLLTSLGVVYYDIDYVKRGLLFLKSLSKPDHILPHAYYWKDDQFVTEYCTSDNWNHLWFIIAASSYLKHSGDKLTLKTIYPMLTKSLLMALKNKQSDDLMYASRPDWWDIGNVYGARSYTTILTYKALLDYINISGILEENTHKLVDYYRLAERMKQKLVEKLWDENANYLINMLDSENIDHHYYAGSILATQFDLLDKEMSTKLLKTVKEKLLDSQIGVRTVIPADFHEQIDIYNFQGMEAGKPYVYLNGGVWPHLNVWYALGLLHNGQVADSKDVIKKYLTLEGIKNSPNGQPSFYEYRNTNVASEKYGEIDKPTFLWAGGLYLHALYQLAGLRVNAFNIYFCPELPDGFENVEYDLMLSGNLCRLRWKGSGKYFKNINCDGVKVHSAVFINAKNDILFERGKPVSPYLAKCTYKVNSVNYDNINGSLKVELMGVPGMENSLQIISPYKVLKYQFKEKSIESRIHVSQQDGIFTYTITSKMITLSDELIVDFKSRGKN